jgi:hypothetical protein
VFPQSFSMKLCVQLPGNRLLNKARSPKPQSAPIRPGPLQKRTPADWKWTPVLKPADAPLRILFHFPR